MGLSPGNMKPELALDRRTIARRASSNGAFGGPQRRRDMIARERRTVRGLARELGITVRCLFRNSGKLAV